MMNSNADQDSGRQEMRRAEFAAKITAIAEHIQPLGAWTLTPTDEESHIWGRHLDQAESNRRLWITPYHGSGGPRMKFQPVGWPTYRDEADRLQTVYPSSLYSPRESTPTATAASGRDPKQIAGQVNRLLAEYDRIFARCEQQATDHQGYADKVSAAAKALAEATGNVWDHTRAGQPGNSTFYLRGLPGETVRVVLQSTSCDIRLDLSEMLSVVDLLYRLRTGKAREESGYIACRECGCTDIQWTAWVDANTGFDTNDEGPTDQAFCPQCEVNGIEGIGKQRHTVMSDERKPLTREGQ